MLSAYGQNVLPDDDEQTVRSKIEMEVRRHSNRFEWYEDGSLSVTHVVPSMLLLRTLSHGLPQDHSSRTNNYQVIRKHQATGLTTWFGNLTSAYGRSKYHGATEPPFLGDDGGYHPLPTFGDGSQIPTEHLDLALEIAESSQVLIEWQPGDVVLLDVNAD